MSIAVLVRVQSIRSQNPWGFGGCIFTGVEITEVGDVVDASSYLVVKAPVSQLGEGRVEKGQWWRVKGKLARFERFVNGYTISEKQIDAVEVTLARVSGEHIVAYLAQSEGCYGVGMAKAQRLWTMFGEDIYRHLDDGNVSALMKVLTEKSAKQIVEVWRSNGSTQTLQWLQACGIEVGVGRKLLAYFGIEAQQKLEEDPYRLLSFSATWKQVDSLARNHFKVGDNDPRRLQGAVEEALYRIFGDGHTCISPQRLLSRLANVLDGPSRALAREAWEKGLSNGSFVVGAQGIHPIGALLMEVTVARAVACRLASSNPQPGVGARRVNQLIAEYEKSECITLNAAQRLAVHTSASNPVSLIVGGAGVGKTTVLKALYKVYDEAHTRIFQVALAGRAAKRMVEATGRPASTIASFLNTVKEGDLAGNCAVVIDEASMVDIISMSRLCELVPAHVQIVLAGDPEQLMPVGPGLVLHAMVGIAAVPKVKLTVVNRYGAEISLAADAVRSGVWPPFSEDTTAAISFVPCPHNAIAERVVDLYANDAQQTQILSSRKTGLDGTIAINALCQARFTKENLRLQSYSNQFKTMAGTGFHLGDKLLCTKNLWDLGLQNGSLGRLVEIEDKPQRLTGPDGRLIGHAIAWALWDDGERRPILESMLEDLELGNAITVHKAQGSQWRRVIVVLTENNILDRTLIYTAMTRASTQVVLVGDPSAARRAVEAAPRVHLRTVALNLILEKHLLLLSQRFA